MKNTDIEVNDKLLNTVTNDETIEDTLYYLKILSLIQYDVVNGYRKGNG